MAQAKMMQQIAFLIMMYGTGYVASIRNGASSSSSSGIQDNYASFDPTDSMTSNFFPSQPMMMAVMSELLQPAARQNEYNFRPSQLLEFTPSDATTASLNYPNYVDAQYPQTTQSDVQFTFPSQRQPSSNALFNNNNYHTSTQSNKLSPEIPTQLQSTPILSYRDPYTNENYYHTPAPAAAASTNRQEFTVHSSMLVHNHRYDTPTYQQQQQHVVPPLAAAATFPSQSYVATPPASFGTSYYTPQYSSHKYETPQYNQRPSALPPVGFDRELPVVLPAQRPTTPPKRISYDSKDYPPPSHHQTSNYLPPPQRQEFSTSSSSSSLQSSSSVPNYANNNNNNNNNNLGNYLQGEQYPQQQQQHYQQQTQSGNYNSRPPSYTTNTQYPPSSYPSTLMRPQYQPSRGGPPQSPPPTYNNYYEYQQGEIPPAPPSYRPPYRPSSYPQQSSSALPDGLASLASLFTSTQQYAPQFSNLLFGGGGGGGGGSSTNALGSLLGAFAGAGGGGGGSTASRPVNMQLIKALENIARNDDLQCVPKVLCQMIAGQTQRGQLPEFVTSPAITNFLSAFPAASPALIYGRAALLGISGGVHSCVQTYGQCPKSEDEILYYLNNHRGGFFKFFSEPEPEKQKPQQTPSAADSSSSLFSILAALTGGGGNTAAAPATTPRPRPRPTAAASADISDGIGSFFTNVLSNYLGGVEYQRRRRRSLDRTDYGDNEKEIEQEKEADGAQDDEEDDEDTQYGDDESEATSDENAESQYDDDAVEGRILNKEISALGAKFFPEAEKAAKIRDSLIAFNKEKASRKLKFPSATTSREYEDAKLMKQDHRGGKEINFKDIEDFDAVQTHHVNFIDNERNHDDDDEDGDIYKKWRAKMVRFQDDNDDVKNTKFSTIVHDIKGVGGKVRFPDSYEEIIRKGRILNRPAYAGGYADYVRNQDDDQDKLVVSDNKRRPHYQSSNFPSSAGNDNNYSAQTYAANSNRYEHSAYLSNNQNGNYHQPSKDSYPRYEYPNNNYANSNRYGAGGSNSYYQQHAVVRTTRSPYEDNKNVYVTNSQGTTEYYIRPDGRKVYL